MPITNSRVVKVTVIARVTGTSTNAEAVKFIEDLVERVSGRQEGPPDGQGYVVASNARIESMEVTVVDLGRH